MQCGHVLCVHVFSLKQQQQTKTLKKTKKNFHVLVLVLVLNNWFTCVHGCFPVPGAKIQHSGHVEELAKTTSLVTSRRS